MLRRIGIVLALTLAVTMAMALPTSASAAINSGSSAKWPWSGHWWPMLDDGKWNLYSDGGPLQKYDSYVLNTTGNGSYSQWWERQNHYTDNQKNNWWGHCHAWAAAAILAPEPKAVSKGQINFTADDLKGLTTALYYEPQYQWLSGNRVDDPNDKSSAKYKDIAPVWMDYLLQYYIGYYHYPFIMDTHPTSEVWNFPVFAYRRSAVPLAGGGERVTTTVYFADEGVRVTGTSYSKRVKTYTYDLKPGTAGEWTGASVHDHPDFAWVPTGKKRGNGTNPYVSEGVLEQITGLNL